MPAKYQKFGLRRDKNLSDLENPTQALGNLIDNLGNETFLPPDLTSAIEGLRNTTLTAEDIQRTFGSVRTFTDNFGNETSFEPLQTIEDNIRNFKVYLGNPPYSGGGDGIDAKFVPWAAMSSIWNASSSSQRKAFTGDQLFNQSYIAPNKIAPGIEGPFDFWDNGIFIFGAKLYDGPERAFTDTYGLVQWEGYAPGGLRFDMETTGLLKIEVDELDDGNWVFIKNIYNETRDNITLLGASYNSGDNVTTITLNDAADTIYICNEDILDISDGKEYTVENLNISDGTFTVEGDATTSSANTVNTYPRTSSFTFELGENQIIETGNDCRLPNTATNGLVKIRISYWFPNYGDGRLFPNKRFVDVDEDGTDRIPYSNFYKEVPSDEPGIFTYEYFEENRLSKRNKFISPRNTDNPSALSGGVLTDLRDQTPLEAGKLIYANYTPPTTFGSRYRGGAVAEYIGGDKFRTYSSFNSISVGDWIVVEAFVNGQNRNGVFTVLDTTRDEDERREVYVDADEIADFITNYGNITSDVYIHVWKVEGLIGFLNLESTGSSSSASTNFTMSNTVGQKLSWDNPVDDLRNDYMIGAISAAVNTSGTVSTPATSFSHFKKATKLSSTSVNADAITNYSDSYTPTATSGYDWIAAVYSHAGLQDLSAESQCAGTYGKEVEATVTTSPAVVQLTDVSGISTGDYVQFGNTSGSTNYVSAYIPDGTTVTNVDTGNNRITLSNNLSTAIPQNATLVFIENNPNGDAKEFCVLPLNTAPPFVGTDAGLRTPSTSRGDATNFPNLVVEELIFAEAQFPDVQLDPNLTTDPTPGNKLDLEASPTYSKTLNIEYNGTNYKLLIA